MEFTRIELFRSRDRRSTNFAVTRWRADGEVLVDVTPGDNPGWQRQGGFAEAFVKAWRMSGPGETVRVRVHERDKRQEWRVVNEYPVQLPRRAWVRPVAWDRGRS